MEFRPITGWHWLDRSSELKGGEDSPFYFTTKRLLDFFLALFLIILFAPLMIVIAILVKLDSKGPALFVQQRVGCRRKKTADGEITWQVSNFSFYKFRSMRSDSNDDVHRTYIRSFVQGDLDKSEKGPAFKLADDTRITYVGRIIRQTSLDELPQLFNVLKGDMSLVGPRPVPTYEVECYEGWHHERFAALPGITGWWQVKGRGEVNFQDMITMDLDYIRNSSTNLDLKIMLLTIPAVLRGRGAE